MKLLHEARLELFKVIEVKNGEIVKTRSLGEHWVNLALNEREKRALAKSFDGDFFTSLSTSRMRELPFHEQYRTIKIKK